MAKKKKPKETLEQKHRKLQDQVQFLPHALADLERKGEKRRYFLLKYVGAPVIRLMKRFMDRQRYKGTEGAKLKQSEQMKRHLEMRGQAMKHMQGEMQKAQKAARRKQR